MISMAVMASSAVMVSSYGANRQTETAMARGLVTRVIRIQPTANGLAKITLDNQAGAVANPVVGSNLQNGLVQTGHTAQLSLSFQ